MARRLTTGGVGLLAGAAAGLLLAPKSGKETREDLRRGMGKIRSSAQSGLERINRELDSQINQLQDLARDLKGEAAAGVKSAVNEAELLRKDIRVVLADWSRLGGDAKVTANRNSRQLMAGGKRMAAELKRLVAGLSQSAKARMQKEK